MLIDGGPCASQSRAVAAPLEDGGMWRLLYFLVSLGTRGRKCECAGAGAIPSCRSLLGGSRLGKSKVAHLLPQDTG